MGHLARSYFLFLPAQAEQSIVLVSLGVFGSCFRDTIEEENETERGEEEKKPSSSSKAMQFRKKRRRKRSLSLSLSSSYRVAELGRQAVRQLGDARRDLVEVDGLLAAVPLLDVHGELEGRERGGEREEVGVARSREERTKV